MNHPSKPIGRLHVITDTVIQDRYSHAELAAMAVEGGADCVQLRDKRISEKERLEVARQVLRVCKAGGVALIVNDSVDVAAASGAHGVHLGRTDTALAEARAVLGPSRIVGGTAGSVEELAAVERDGADYAGFGHIFPTGSKVKAGPPVGVAGLSTAARSVKIPVIAIGGITAENAADAIAAGAWGVAVIGAVCLADDPVRAVRELKQVITRARGG